VEKTELTLKAKKDILGITVTLLVVPRSLKN